MQMVNKPKIIVDKHPACCHERKEKKSTNLTRKEKGWIIEEIHGLLTSSHDCHGMDWKEYDKKDKILQKGITEESWNLNYDLPKSELKTMKNIWGKLHE